MTTRRRSKGRNSHRFAVDERLVMPETRFEAIEGEVVYVSPADQAHGSRHSKLSALLEAYVAPGYDAASDMFTRTSEKAISRRTAASIPPRRMRPLAAGSSRSSRSRSSAPNA